MYSNSWFVSFRRKHCIKLNLSKETYFSPSGHLKYTEVNCTTKISQFKKITVTNKYNSHIKLCSQESLTATRYILYI